MTTSAHDIHRGVNVNVKALQKFTIKVSVSYAARREEHNWRCGDHINLRGRLLMVSAISFLAEDLLC